MIYIFLAILAGISIVIARIINSNLANKIGLFQGTFFNFVTGLLVSLIFLFFSNENFDMSYVKITSVPLWAYLGGLTGVLIVVGSSYVTPKISAFYLTLLMFIGQLFVGIIIDYFTYNKLPLGKTIGCFLVLIGLTYNLLLDKKSIRES